MGLSISYDKGLRLKTSLALYTLETCQNTIPLPSHFHKSNFTTAAFDNFDHNEATQSGLQSTHDTVSVLFQDATDKSCFKLKISSTSVDKQSRTLNKNLEFQTLKNFNKPTGNIIIPSEAPRNVLFSSQQFSIINSQDLLWVISRMSISKGSESVDDNKKIQTIPTWTAFNSTLCEDKRQTQKIGFLPILPYPVTDYSTVYTAMCNFKDILSQIKKIYLYFATKVFTV